MASRGIPMEEIPADAEPISEEQFERLPQYVVDTMAKSLAGELVPTTRDQLNEIHSQYFMKRVEEAIMELDSEDSAPGKRPIDSISNSPSEINSKMDEVDP